LKGAVEGDHAALCTSQADVQNWLTDSVASICRAVPDLAGFFTITGSENLTNCWSHGGGANCPRCSQRSPSEVIAELNGLVAQGIHQSGSRARLIVWDWGWADAWVDGIIARLPTDAALMSVSEWGIPIRRGGVETRVGEYSISTIGPGARAHRHWELARRRGLKTIAKIQAGNTWELSAVPYIPALENVGRHAANLRQAGVDGLMLGWTLGGYPSPNLELIAELARGPQNHMDETRQVRAGDLSESVATALRAVAARRFGATLANAVVNAWQDFSAAFREFPFDAGVVYNAPMQCGPSNLLWARPTGYRATMVGFPYDDLDAWRGPYPADIFMSQLDKVATGFEAATESLRRTVEAQRQAMNREQQHNLADELTVAEAAAIHFRSTANQARFVQLRGELAKGKTGESPKSGAAPLGQLLRDEIQLARRLYSIQTKDSRIGFEATNQYYYVPLDLVEKVLNCQSLLERWLTGPGPD
jgi:hypothetical protein